MFSLIEGIFGCGPWKSYKQHHVNVQILVFQLTCQESTSAAAKKQIYFRQICQVSFGTMCIVRTLLAPPIDKELRLSVRNFALELSVSSKLPKNGPREPESASFRWIIDSKHGDGCPDPSARSCDNSFMSDQSFGRNTDLQSLSRDCCKVISELSVIWGQAGESAPELLTSS